MKRLSIGVGILVLCHVHAQKVSWQRDIPSSTQDFLTTMTSTIDRQILLSGSSIQSRKTEDGGQKQNSGYDYHIVKLDQQGSKLWERYFGGSRHDYLASSIATEEGGFALVGTSFSNISGDKNENNFGGSDLWLLRLNENGEELWQKTLGTKSNDEASAIVQSTDQGFFVAGNINNHKKLFGSKDVFVSKLEKDGKLKQTIILGGKALDEVTDMIPTPDGGVVLLVYSTSGKAVNINNTDRTHSQNNAPNTSSENINPEITSTVKTFIGKSEDGFGNGDYWIVKLDKNANIEWQKTYGGTGDDRPKAIANTQNGYIIAGESRSSSSGNKKGDIKEGTDLWVINLDKSGNDIWQKNYSFGNRDVAMSLDVIRKTNKDNYSEDKGFLLGGYTQAEEKMEKDDEKFWMLYIDTNGKEGWRKYVEGKEKKNEERLVSAKLQSDASYLLAGTSAEELGKENWKIVKLRDEQLDDLMENKDIRIYPNPVRDHAYVEIGLDYQSADIYVYDMAGKVIQQLQTKNKVTKVDTSKLPQGVYVIKANIPTQKDKKLTTKIVKE
ncbi:T9SS type A sorting domain-containing protein [Epilithonimonas hungarica]|uniref:Por secretion system C-terminal sorting domain-containing protein n=1 Tax=Epilithonimonas hungarica TaxID=454006 RepID=A0A1G7VU96_9FLAO|nr:T9SS type A sorting domain-containing protein [Epilithonimonas hungarica]SDG63395.1 Por secretion system C-terminal sorting domain-containing protein [Epilithonimonas hungarica]